MIDAQSIANELGVPYSDSVSYEGNPVQTFKVAVDTLDELIAHMRDRIEVLHEIEKVVAQVIDSDELIVFFKVRCIIKPFINI